MDHVPVYHPKWQSSAFTLAQWSIDEWDSFSGPPHPEYTRTLIWLLISFIVTITGQEVHLMDSQHMGPFLRPLLMKPMFWAP